MTNITADTALFTDFTSYPQSENNTMNDVMEEKERESPPIEFNGNHEHPADTDDAIMDADLMGILADVAAKSPVNNTMPKEEIPLVDPTAIEFPMSSDDSNKKRPAEEEEAKKPAAKRVKKQAPSKQQGVKRSTRARKLPTKLKPRPSSMTSSSSAMSAAAILMGVAASNNSSEGEQPQTTATTTQKKKRAPRKKGDGKVKKKSSGNESNLRGITMKRPGKWVSSYICYSILILLFYCCSLSNNTFILFFYFHSKLSFIIQDNLDTLESLPVKKRLPKRTRLYARLSSRTLHLHRRVPRNRLKLLADVPMKQSAKHFPMATRELLLLWLLLRRARCQCKTGGCKLAL